jgi:type II restriction enzyme
MIGYRPGIAGAGRRQMDLCFEAAIADAYVSGLQRARVLTEHWVAGHVYCPNCGNLQIARYGNNNPVGDFYCSICKEEYELKSQRARFGAKVADGAYRAMIQRLGASTNPNLFLLNYDVKSLRVTNLVIIPKHFFTVELIEERKPLLPTARRAGWVGCRILLDGIPEAGRIAIIRNGVVEPKAEVRRKWQRTLFLRQQRDLEAKSWLVHVMRCIERLGKSQFSLDEVYGFETELSSVYPDNRHVRAKIRQKLQVLRDNEFLEFSGRGVYRLSGAKD